MRGARAPVDHAQHSTEGPREAGQRELRSGEELIWADRPDPSVMAKKQLFSLIVGIPFFCFACFWTVFAWNLLGDRPISGLGAAGNIVPFIFPIFGLPFIGVGLWLLSAPLRAKRKARRTVYGITNLRLFIAVQGSRRKVQSFEPEDIASIERNDDGTGFGDVIFARELRRSHSKHGDDFHTVKIGFYGIPEVRKVETAVAELRARRGGGTGTGR